MRRLLQPILKLFFNPNPLIQALNIQSRLNTMYAEREARREAARHAFDQLHYEVLHNLVVETTRLGIEVKNLKMRVESLTSRLEFNERRARALESVVVYKPAPEDRVEAPPAREAAASRNRLRSSNRASASASAARRAAQPATGNRKVRDSAADAGGAAADDAEADRSPPSWRTAPGGPAPAQPRIRCR